MEAAANPLTEAKIHLGRMLFYDPRLSLNRDVSCNSCHDLKRYGVDGRPTSTGHGGQRAIATHPRSITLPDSLRSSGTGARKTWKSRPRGRC